MFTTVGICFCLLLIDSFNLILTRYFVLHVVIGLLFMLFNWFIICSLCCLIGSTVFSICSIAIILFFLDMAPGRRHTLRSTQSAQSEPIRQAISNNTPISSSVGNGAVYSTHLHNFSIYFIYLKNCS